MQRTAVVARHPRERIPRLRALQHECVRVRHCPFVQLTMLSPATILHR
jgi:hypothetical protein